jgi:uncharacterized protein (TIGR00255 family)
LRREPASRSENAGRKPAVPPAPLRSMTGFGAASVAKGKIVARVEVRSVNHRHIQVKTRLGSEQSHLEPAMEALVREKLERGSISLSATVEREAAAGAARVNAEVARRYQKLLMSLAKELRLEGGVRLDTLIGLPGVIGSAEDDSRREAEDELLLGCARKALEELLKMRAREGASLLADLRKNTAGIAKLVAGIEARMPEVVREHHESLRSRVELLLNGQSGRVAVRPEDLAREVALLADKMDVGEEIARLTSHLGQWESLLSKGGSVGRQLEFLVQELLREANTIGSKCNDAKVAHAVVELKTLIERLREQVQNVE